MKILSIKSCKPRAGESIKTVVGSLTDGANDLAEVPCVQLYESGIDVIVQSTSVAFRNFHHSWVSVLMDQSDFNFSPVVIFIQAVGNPQDTSAGFSRSQNLYYGRNEALINLEWQNQSWTDQFLLPSGKLSSDIL